MLYEHQKSGVEWLVTRKRAMLLDEQGLGKTITAIVATDELLSLQICKVLVIVPAVVLWNWEHEWDKWFPERIVQVISTGKQDIDDIADVVITTHSLLLAPHLRKQILMRQWGIVILDECQMFRTPKAQRTVAFYGKYERATNRVTDRADIIWCLTGTPMPNNVSELWTHIWGLDPDRLIDEHGTVMSYFRFRRRFCILKETMWGMKVIGNRNLKELKKRMEGLTLRRLKKDVLNLPDIRFETITLRPKNMPKKVLALSGLITEAMSATQQLSVIKNTEEFSRWRRLSGIAKAEPVAELLDMELHDGGLKKIVVFAHHRDVIDDIVDYLSPKYGVCVITGSTNPKDRKLLVDKFQTDPGIRVIICNIVAGGIGITLTAASEVLFAELSPVPGDNAQAADRVHRIGQDQKVRVRFAALAGTVDETIVEILRVKTRMIREALS
jgi:SWI/SNF-related matrix-associated actin-dependent regulator 1 of chromatin subfamily A